jgi:hypothetical protein
VQTVLLAVLIGLGTRLSNIGANESVGRSG